jgi:hypothetical protein
MELSVHALHADAALVPCRGRHGTRNSPRRFDERDHHYILASVGRCVAAVSGTTIGSNVS